MVALYSIRFILIVYYTYLTRKEIVMRFAIRFAKANDQEIIIQYAECLEREFNILRLTSGPILSAYHKRAQGSQMEEHRLISTASYVHVATMMSMLEFGTEVTDSLLEDVHKTLDNLSLSIIPFNSAGDMLGAEVYIHDMLISDGRPIWTDHIESVRVLLYDTDKRP